MLHSLLLLAILSADPETDALRRELDDVASQIEQLKSRRRAGDPIAEESLERLLVRSQELAERIERASPGPPPAAPAVESDPRCELVDELREQAAGLRDEAAGVADEAAQVAAELARALEEEPAASHAVTFTSDLQTILDPATRIGALSERQSALEEKARALAAQASIMDAAADALERAQEPEPRTPRGL
jgi:hypothetical protein